MLIIVNVLVTLLCFMLAYHELRGLQLNGYKIKFMFNDAIKTIYKYSFICMAIGLTLWFSILNYIALVSFLSFSALLGALYYLIISITERTKLKFTKRMLRLISATVLVTVGIELIIGIMVENIFLYAVCQSCFVISYVGIVKLMAKILEPLEKKNNARYIRRAERTIKSLKAIKIAITGSYGKTSCKNILYEMLKDEYVTIKTEKNYNTPLGIALSSKRFQGDEEVFIAEMGARRVGEIKELADIVHPTIAIITGVGNQHLDTFKTAENIFRTKKELLDSLPSNGFCVLNGENAYCCRMAAETSVNTVLVNLHQNNGVYAKNIKLSNSGSTFTLCGLGEECEISTRLLGMHNIINIMLSAAVAHHLSVKTSSIVSVIKGLRATPHRLELIENSRNITIIDDSYNCNVEGAKFALEVLALFNGRKVVFTQGIVELGDASEEINSSLGTLIANVADAVILVGVNTKLLEKGLLGSGFPTAKIYKFDSLQSAQNAFKDILEVGDVLLIQNDIP